MSAVSPATDLSAVWRGDDARLDRVLTELGLVRSRSQATERISAGVVTVNGSVITKTGAKIAAGAQLQVHEADAYVSRAAHKLIAGLDAFHVSAADRVCLDVGASTGGFTQVLLERGATVVHAIDVGHGQMVPQLRDDPRVVMREGVNARDLTSAGLGLSDASTTAYPSLIVGDLSFISLRLVFDALARVAAPGADLVLLVKPQFEVGRTGVRGGIVFDAQLAAAAILEVFATAAALGYGVHDMIPSPIAGGYGNQEFVVHFSQRVAFDHLVWRDRVAELTAATIGNTTDRGLSLHRSDA